MQKYSKKSNKIHKRILNHHLDSDFILVVTIQ